MLLGVRWYGAYPLRTRQVEELMLERGVPVDPSTIQHWVSPYSPQLADTVQRRTRPVGLSWRLDEPSISVQGEWPYLYRAVDKYGATRDFLLTEHRDKDAALRFLQKALRRNGVPAPSTLDGSDAHAAASKSANAAHGPSSAMRQAQYLHHGVAQAHRAGKHVTRPMLGCKAFEAAPSPLSGIELMPMLKKRQMGVAAGDEGRTAAALRPHCSIPWPRHPATDQGHCPCMIS